MSTPQSITRLRKLDLMKCRLRRYQDPATRHLRLAEADISDRAYTNGRLLAQQEQLVANSERQAYALESIGQAILGSRT